MTMADTAMANGDGDGDGHCDSNGHSYGLGRGDGDGDSYGNSDWDFFDDMYDQVMGFVRLPMFDGVDGADRTVGTVMVAMAMATREAIIMNSTAKLMMMMMEYGECIGTTPLPRRAGLKHDNTYNAEASRKTRKKAIVCATQIRRLQRPHAVMH